MSSDSGVSADDVISGIELILGRTPDQALVDYHVSLRFRNRAELGKYLMSTDEFKNRLMGIDPTSNIWEQRAQRAAERKQRLKSFGPCACGLLVNTANGLFAVNPEDESVSAALLQHGCYAEEELGLLKKLITQDSSVLVVGSHIGAHVVPLAKKCKAVVAIEANPNTFKLLRTNIILNECKNVMLYNIAASDKEEVIKFLLNRANSGGSKRMPHESYIHYTYDNPEVIEIRAFPLDDTLGDESFDLIVMDIEGSEYFALRGMQNHLSRARALAVEFLPHHLRDIANVGIDQFVEAILPHFNKMHIEHRDIVNDKSNIRTTLVEMFNANEGHDLIFFMK
jgi:FkbM family methyltransferase